MMACPLRCSCLRKTIAGFFCEVEKDDKGIHIGGRRIPLKDSRDVKEEVLGWSGVPMSSAIAHSKCPMLGGDEEDGE